MPTQRRELGLRPSERAGAGILPPEEHPHVKTVVAQARKEDVLGHVGDGLALPAAIVPELSELVGHAAARREVTPRLPARVRSRDEDPVLREGAKARVREHPGGFPEGRGRRLSNPKAARRRRSGAPSVSARESNRPAARVVCAPCA